MRKRICLLLLAAATLLSGCSMGTVDKMYHLPRRSEMYDDLQITIDAAMVGHEYCAPQSGEYQQTVQMEDLNGDGQEEYLLFAKQTGEKPLEIMIFSQTNGTFSLVETIDSNGSAFDLVEYVQMDGVPGMELVVGRQLSNEVVRSVSVYTFRDGQAEQLMTTNYIKFLTCDLDTDGLSELLVLKPGQTETDNGVAELFGVEHGSIERSNEAAMSGPTDKLRRIIIGKLHGGKPAVFVGTTVQESAIITDVYAVTDGVFTNVSLSNESGTSVQTLRNYYVYAEDIDDDGEVELPSLITMTPLEQGRMTDDQYLIRWYAMAPDGSEIDKMYTYHNFVGGWYLPLDAAWASRISVQQQGSEYAFYLWDEAYSQAEKMFSVYVLTGQNREEQARKDNRFVLHRGEATVYAAHLEVASGALGITQDDLVHAFHLIRQDWKTGEM